jgi:hypothetical protein
MRRRLMWLGASAIAALLLAGCVASPHPDVPPTPRDSAAPVIERPDVPATLEAPELAPYYPDSELVVQLTSADHLVSMGPFEDKGGGLVMAVDCAGSGTVTVRFGELGLFTARCHSTVDEPVLHYLNENFTGIDTFQLEIETTGDVVWGLSLGTYPPGPQVAAG